MADLDGNKTVIVDRDRADRSSPVGWIILALLLLLAIWFFMSGGFGLFGGSDANDATEINNTSETQIETPAGNPSTTDEQEPVTP